MRGESSFMMAIALFLSLLLGAPNIDAQCAIPPVAPGFDRPTSSFSWALREGYETPILLSRNMVYGAKRSSLRVLLACQDNGRESFVVKASRFRLLTGSLFATISSPDLRFTHYEATEFLGYREIGWSKVTPSGTGSYPAELLGDGYVKLRPGRPLQLKRLSSEKVKEQVPIQIVVIGSPHALSLAPLARWEEGWGGDPIDQQVGLKITWLPVSLDGEVLSPRVVAKLSELHRFAEKKVATVAAIDRTPTLENLARYLDGFAIDKADYFFFLKDGWDVTANGVGLLSRQLNRRLPGVSFDIFSTRTATASKGLLEGLCAEHEGRYFESEEKDSMNKFSQDLGDRILGKIRTRARAQAARLGLELMSPRMVANELIVSAKDPSVDLFYRLPLEDLDRMEYLFRLALCWSDGERVGPLGLEALLLRAGLYSKKKDQMKVLFRAWFKGFELPAGSPFIRDTTEDMMQRVVERPEVRAHVQQILESIDLARKKQKGCSAALPLDTFVLD